MLAGGLKPSQDSSQKNFLHVGIIISEFSRSSPNISEFSFIITEPERCSIFQGQYCITSSIEGLLVGYVEEIYVSNQYFQNAQTVKSFNHANVDLQKFFLSDHWECHIARISVLGTIKGQFKYTMDLPNHLFTQFDKVGFPATPGNKVYSVFSHHLFKILGLDEVGLSIGNLKNYDLPVNLNLNRLFNKHLAILAQSGAGKSYLISVMLEELLQRSDELGSPAMILIDVHGEYDFSFDSNSSLSDQNFRIAKKIQRYNASFLQIGVPSLSEYDFKRYQPNISQPQLRELRKAIKICKQKYKPSKNKFKNQNNHKDSKREKRDKIDIKTDDSSSEDTSNDEITSVQSSSCSTGYDIFDLIQVLENEMEINTNVRDTLIGWLEDLNQLHFFGKITRPAMNNMAKINHLVILDFSSIISQRKKAILLEFYSSQLFYLRRQSRIPPFILFLEEAHNFLPSSDSKTAYAKGIIETIAREGRKFFAQLVLVSQRPVRLSTTVLSQCNSQIIMRITNPYDLQHIKETSEHLSASAIKMITTLPTGNALVVGRALNFPVFMQIREKIFPAQKISDSLTDVISRFNYQPETGGITNTHTPPPQVHYLQEDFIEPDFND